MSDPQVQRLQNEIDRLKSAIQELTVLNDIAIAASSTLEVDQVLDVIVEKSIRAVQAEQGSILLLTEQEDTPLKTLIRQESLMTGKYATYKVGASITGWVLKHQQPLKIDDLAADSRFNTTPEERRHIQSALCIPIRFRSEMLGILIVTNKKTGSPFTDSDLRLLSIIASQSGQLIRNSQLQEETIAKKRMEQELAMARTIQQGLLPTASIDADTLDIASYFNPADEVSGDYYDYFQLGEGRIGIVMADVSGHGTSSALMMTMVKGILHTLANEFSTTDELLSKSNVILTQIMPPSMFVTVTFLVFDMTQRRLHYSNAGHNPLIRCSKQHKSELIELRGPAIGLTKLAKYREMAIDLHAGDVYVLYTDGITEAFNHANEMFEETGLLQAVAECGSAGRADEMVSQIVRKVGDFTGGAAQNDDMAIIAIKVK